MASPVITPAEALEALASARGYEVRTPAWLGAEPAECVELFRKGDRLRSLTVICHTDGRPLAYEVAAPARLRRHLARAADVLALLGSFL